MSETTTAASRDGDAVLAGVVDLLDSSPSFASEPSRQLLLRRVEHHLERRIYVPDQSYRRYWLLAMVEALETEPGGLPALAAAVSDVARGSRLAHLVTAAAQNYDVAVGAAPGPQRASGQTSVASAAGASGPEETGSEELTPAQCLALARAFSDVTVVKDVMERAGVPRERLPSWDGLDAEAYWRLIARLVREGVVPDGPRAVLAAAAESFPANSIFVPCGPTGG